MNIQEISILEIKPDPDQPRKTFDPETMERLSQSIKDNGIEQPIIVRKNGAGYIIIDGERRWRASKENGLKTIPSIISDKNNVLEQQLRSDCLKEGLSADELDKAIYQYYDQLETSFELDYNKWVEKNIGSNNKESKYTYVAAKIGKSVPRVRIAIDRFEFKDANPDVEKKFKKTEGGHDIFNSTIPMTSGIKDNDTRREVLETALEYKSDGFIQNEDVKEAVKEIKSKNITDKKKIKEVFQHKADQRYTEKWRQKSESPKSQKENKNTNAHRDAAEALERTTKTLSIVCNGMGEIFKLWDFIDDELRREYLVVAKHFVGLHKKNLKSNYKLIGE